LAGVPTILITGAAGQIGSMLRTRLARPGRTLRLLDAAPLDPASVDPAPVDSVLVDPASVDPAPVDSVLVDSALVDPALVDPVPVDTAPAEEWVTASVTDLDAMTAACAGVDAVIHLAAIADEATWERIAAVNIEGTYVAFEAARRAGVPRVVYASSNHAVGFAPRSEFPVPDYAFPAPDTYYGVAKVTGEALAALYHHRYGMDTICLRILSCSWKPRSARSLSTWLSPDDAGRLFEACLTVADPGFRVAYGVSANTRGGWVSLAEARALGYEPRDDAEDLAAEVIAEHGEPDPADPVFAYLGGEFTLPAYDADHLK
jgi:nucleoside-diphosphate-sugar epimerase